MPINTEYVPIDPICGMQLRPHQIVADFDYLRSTYSFCSTECREIFARTPEKYIVMLAHEPGESYGHDCPIHRDGRSDANRIKGADG